MYKSRIYCKLGIFLLTIAMMVIFSTRIDAAEADAPAQWRSLNPGVMPSPAAPIMPPNNRLFSMFSFHDKLYAATNPFEGGLWSYDDGTWTEESSPPAIVTNMVELDGALYAGTYDPADSRDGVWTYRDGNWTRMTGSPGSVSNILLDDSSGTIYASTYAGDRVIWSYRNGEWTQVDGSPSNVYCIFYLDGTLYAGTDEGETGIWSYRNGVWKATQGSPTEVYDLIEINGTLYAIGGQDWTVWTYANDTWTQTPSSPRYVSQLANVNGKLYADSNNELWSYDGQTWEHENNAPYEMYYAYRLVGVDGVLYWGNIGSIASYVNGNWTLVSGLPSYATSLTYVEDYLLYAGMYGGEVGDIWLYGSGEPFEEDQLAEREQVRNSPVNVTSFASLQGKTYAGSMSGNWDVWLLDDRTITWSPIENSPSGVQMLVPIQDTLYAATYFDLWSYDGSSWTQMSGAPSNVVSMVQLGDTLYVGTGDDGSAVYAYRDGKWSHSIGSPGRAKALASFNGTLYAGSANGAVYSLSNGVWTRTNNSPDNIRSFVELNGRLYAGTWNGGNDVWVYDGTSWTQMPGSPSNVLSLLNEKGTLFTAGASGVSRITLYTPPGDPTAVTVQAGDRQVTLSFTAPDNDGGTPITGYEVTWDYDQEFLVTKSSPITITDLMNNHDYYFTVKAINGVGASQGVTSKGVKPVSPTVPNEVDDTPVPGDDGHTTPGGGDNTTTEPGQGGNTTAPGEGGVALSFSDVEGHWAMANIKKAVSEGIVKGYSDGTFKPNQTVTRAEFVVMLMNALKPQDEGAALTFTDLDQIGSWAKKAVAQAVSQGIITGYQDGSFRPDAEITRTEMAAMIAKALGQPIPVNETTGFSDDKDIPRWAKGAVAYVKQAGIVKGKGNNEFAPQDHATRAEAVTIILNLLAQITSKVQE